MGGPECDTLASCLSTGSATWGQDTGLAQGVRMETDCDFWWSIPLPSYWERFERQRGSWSPGVPRAHYKAGVVLNATPLSARLLLRAIP